ncbi:oxidoreductase [Streptomyces agglomeratus]|uniref:Oxidoreductase n=1 Tax=Streptomyces agglomeratus TaxID=285458 RepID=A0A1E5PGK8_9ACTN|nr:CBS domain-containing protein [Streptomyces agglomeratus]OEJ28514.1 oxidoreductase [Streptomyces agglomeratus]OEJ37422.1 oxidoreductase [Streptomyces agglomeratus]OEJ48193.1 oxidoreductase [Streptomyces agglomeratus]OEJ49963.1 oxidoreductase [Streptomyces agglomeratus]OEJ57290.1 oxidoreductase [Streptomyces agglomeratus]
MARKVREVMTAAPVTVGPQTSVGEVARVMRDEGIGAVLVAEGDELRGLVTDRDLAVRIVAREGDIADYSVADACSDELITVSLDDDLDRAVSLMRQHAVRRLPVVEDGLPVGIVSLGDLAVEHETDSALADISAADPNQ